MKNYLHSTPFARRTPVYLQVLGIAVCLMAGSTWAQQPPPGSSPPPSGTRFMTPLPPPASTAPKPSSDPHDFNGVYVGTPNQGIAGMTGVKPPAYTPEVAKLVASRRQMQKNNQTVETPWIKCRPFNIMGVAQSLFPTAIAQNKKRLVILTEEGRTVWEIFLDRDHPKKMTQTYNGHSVGRWEGDTLVVDIVGFNGKQWLDFIAGPQSTDTHMTVRIKKIDEGRKLDFTFEVTDPKTYTEPMVYHYTLDWNPEVRLLEFGCEDSIDIGSYPGIVPEKT